MLSITQEGFELPKNEEETAAFTKLQEEYTSFCEKIKEILSNKVEKVVITDRLQDVPCCIVTGQFGWSANMERIMRSQALNDTTSMSYMIGKKNMEINPYHNIIKELKPKLINPDSEVGARDLINLLYETSLINSGFTLENTSTFAERIFRIVQLGLGIENLSSEEDTNEQCQEKCCPEESCPSEKSVNKCEDSCQRKCQEGNDKNLEENEMEEVD